MSDLVKRLRDYASNTASNLGGISGDYLTWQAADRVEALETALRRIVNGGTMALLTASMDECPVNPDALEQIINDARAALSPERADG